MAARMAEGLKRVGGAKLLHPVEANELFVALPEETARSLESQGFYFYRWPLHAAESAVTIRLVTCFATLSADVDEFIAAAAAIKPSG
jgi:threonine aldolase